MSAQSRIIPVIGLLCYCRPGYEQNLAQELEQHCAQANLFGYAKAKPDSGFVFFSLYAPLSLDIDAETNKTVLDFSTLMFARQLLCVVAHLPLLDRQDRLQEIEQALIDIFPANTDPQAKTLFATAVVESADTEEGKELSKFCRKVSVPFRQMLRQQQWLMRRKFQHALVGNTLHAFFEHGSAAYIALSLNHNRSQHENGIYRLKFPQDAPSRSTLKLEEAIQTFLSAQQQSMLLCKGLSAVDLGACPGGWTYQLVQRGVHVEAVDNGAMDPALMATGLVTYAAADGFTYRPEYGKVDWLVCDMIEQPSRVAALMAHWLVEGLASHAIFNLKLPMKQRYTAMQSAQSGIEAALNKAKIDFTWQAKHLYHNRDEVTVCIITKPQNT